MTKRLVAKVGTYEKNGETKGEYVKIGALLNGNNGEYLLLDPTINLAGVLAKQNVMALNEGKIQRDSVMCSLFEDDNNQQQGQQQQAPQQGYQQAPQQGYHQR